MAWECGFNAVEVESDALSIIHMLSSVSLRLGPIGLVIEDILSKTHCFSSISFCYTSRLCNKVAHATAKWALSLKEDQILMKDVPQEIGPLVLYDAGFFP